MFTDSAVLKLLCNRRDLLEGLIDCTSDYELKEEYRQELLSVQDEIHDIEKNAVVAR